MSDWVRERLTHQKADASRSGTKSYASLDSYREPVDPAFFAADRDAAASVGDTYAKLRGVRRVSSIPSMFATHVTGNYEYHSGNTD